MSDRNKEHTTKAQVNEVPADAVTAAGIRDAGGNGPDGAEETAGREQRSPSYPPEDTSQQKIVIDDTVDDFTRLAKTFGPQGLAKDVCHILQ